MLSGIRRVVCGISGGVDSAVAAYLLKKTGYDVHGLYMKNWDHSDEVGRCTGDVDIEDARFTCRHLNIPFHEVNFVKQYWNEVFSYLITEYESGRTPNPDVLCNKHIKFDSFLNYALGTLKADAIATGHYAKSSITDRENGNKAEQGIRLLKAVDEFKDQTLFLCQISQSSLHKVLFPLGDLTKNKVKQIAVDIGLERIARRKESMGICFIGSRNFHSFIEEYIEPRPANFIDIEDGKVVGRHKGLHYWTLGQRCHLPGLSKAYFVAEKNTKSQDIYVAQGTDHPALFTQSFKTGTLHWIRKPLLFPENGGSVEVDFRFQHMHPAIACSVSRVANDCLLVSLSRPMRAITPGQFAVFYKGQECLGSAQIETLAPTLYHQNHTERVNNPKIFA